MSNEQVIVSDISTNQNDKGHDHQMENDSFKILLNTEVNANDFDGKFGVQEVLLSSTTPTALANNSVVDVVSQFKPTPNATDQVSIGLVAPTSVSSNGNQTIHQSTTTSYGHLHYHSNHHHSHNFYGGMNSNVLLGTTMSSPHTSMSAANNKRNYRVVVSALPPNHISNNTTATASGSSHNRASASSIVTGVINNNGNNKVTSNTTNARWVTRELAALDFLLNIPLELEPKIVQDGWSKLQLQYNQQNHHDDNSISRSDSESHTGRTEDDEDRRGDADFGVLFPSPKGTWWEKWINKADTNNQQQQQLGRGDLTSNNTELLEDPTRDDINNDRSLKPNVVASSMFYAPGGRRLDGDDAIYIRIPFDAYTTVLKSTMQKDIAKQAAVRQWEIQTAHGIIPSQTQQQQQQQKNKSTKQENQTQKSQPPLLDGRMFFSSNNSYPVSVFSMIRYEPKREEAAFRRRKLEAIGGGGSQFAMPLRDWRGISYRALLPRRAEKADKKFNKFLRRRANKISVRSDKTKVTASDMSERSVITSSASSTSSSSSSSDDESSTDGYVPGLLDDPDMVQGRHRNVMIGDHVTGPIVASTIQFVEPALLKAELNKQFRERFDGWEPPKAARKYIGARIINGNYVLMDPTDGDGNDNYHVASSNNSVADDQSSIERKPLTRPKRRPRQHSVTSIESANESSTTGAGNASALPKEKTIRMPPSLTLSKIRSIKAQALKASIAANLEISTVALACVFFERLCLDCRVDKSNRRLAFAACLLLAAKLNESNVGLVMKPNNKSSGNDQVDGSGSEDESNIKPGGRRKVKLLQALIRPTKRSNTMFASLLQFFAQDWSLSLKQLFDAEWGVFAALGFSLTSNPTHVAFHYKRLMKALEKNPIDYLGREMYQQWQDVLADEEERRMKRERKMEAHRKRKEEQILNMHIEIENEVLRRKEARAQQKTNDTDSIPADDDSSKKREEIKDEQSLVSRGSPPKTVTLSRQPPPFLQSISNVGSSVGNNNLKPVERVSVRKGIGGMNFLHRFGMRRSVSQDRLNIAADVPSSNITATPVTNPRLLKRVSFDEEVGGLNPNVPSPITRLRPSPSLPDLAIISSDLNTITIDIPQLPDLTNIRLSNQEQNFFGGTENKKDYVDYDEDV